MKKRQQSEHSWEGIGAGENPEKPEEFRETQPNLHFSQVVVPILQIF